MFHLSLNKELNSIEERLLSKYIQYMYVGTWYSNYRTYEGEQDVKMKEWNVNIHLEYHKAKYEYAKACAVKYK